MTHHGDSAALTRAGLDALSDSERLLIASLRTIAGNLAHATGGMSDQAAEQQISAAIFELVQSLGAVSEDFAAETERYIRQAVSRARLH